MGDVKMIKMDEVKEEQIWGKQVMLYEKKLYRDDKIAINLRRLPVQKSGALSEGGYQFHTHDDSTEICVNLKGKLTGHYDPVGLFNVQGGDLVIIPPHTNHGAVSVEEEMTILVIFVPPPKVRY